MEKDLNYEQCGDEPGLVGHDLWGGGGQGDP